MRAVVDRTPIVVDATPPRSLDSPVLKVDTRSVVAVVTLYGIVAAWLLLMTFISFDWLTFGVFGAADLGLCALAVRQLIQWRRFRRWRNGTLVEVSVLKSSLAWKDVNGAAYTLDLGIKGGRKLTFEYFQGQVEGATYPALVHDGWILIVFHLRATELRRLNPA